MKIDRRQFLKTLSGIIAVPALGRLDLTKPKDVETGWEYLGSNPIGFIVDSTNEIALEDYWLDDIVFYRRDIYGISPDHIRTIDDLECAIQEHQSLCWLLNDRYWEFLDHVEEVEEDYEVDSDAADDGDFVIPVRPGDEKWPPDYDGNPKVLKRWSNAMGEERFLADAREWIEAWLNDEPESAEYDEDQFDLPASGASYAYDYFSADPSLSELLTVGIIEGSFPGNSYRGAVLESSVDDVNEICRENGLPLRFTALES